MESLLRKYLWTLDFAVAAICAVFMARASASLIESRYLTLAPPKPNSGGMDTSFTATRSKAPDDICRRNIFCSATTCVCKLGPDKVENTASSTGQVEEQKSSLPYSVLAIMYAEPPLGWKWSMAVLRDNDSKAQGPYGVGMKLRERVTVLAIDETRVHLDNEGKQEYLDLIDVAPPPAAPTAAAPPTESAPASDPLAKELEAGIKKTGENTYEIQRNTLDQVLGNMSLLSRSARIVPEIRDGKAAGFRLYSVRPDGPFAKIGMQNGDVISAINGLEMTSPEKALEVYSRLKSANHLSLGLERNGQKVTKDYSIR